MNIKCKVCANAHLDDCHPGAWPNMCGAFEIGMDKLLETAHEVAIENHIAYGDALKAIDICLKYGGYVVD